MNKFKESLKIDVEKKKKIDDKISANIAKILSDMSMNSNDKEEKIQILDRMLNINAIFEDFDTEIEVLKLERERRKTIKTKRMSNIKMEEEEK